MDTSMTILKGLLDHMRAVRFLMDPKYDHIRVQLDAFADALERSHDLETMPDPREAAVNVKEERL